METILSENLMETISFYDQQESYYHGFLTGMLKNIGNYIVLSNREAGNGRPDILLKYPSVKGKSGHPGDQSGKDIPGIGKKV